MMGFLVRGGVLFCFVGFVEQLKRPGPRLFLQNVEAQIAGFANGSFVILDGCFDEFRSM